LFLCSTTKETGRMSEVEDEEAGLWLMKKFW
jgi:hypothetical protein